MKYFRGGSVPRCTAEAPRDSRRISLCALRCTYDGRLIQLGCPPLSTHNVVNLVVLARRIVRFVESDPRAMRQDDVCIVAPDSSLSKHVFSRYRCIWVQVHNIHDRLRPL